MGPAPRYLGNSDACTLTIPSGARSIHGLRNDLAVTPPTHWLPAGARAGIRRFRQRTRLRLADGEAQPRGGFFHRRRRGVLSAAAGRLGLGHHCQHLVAGLHQALERGDSEGWSSQKDQAHPAAQPHSPERWSFLILRFIRSRLQRADVGNVEAAVRWSVSCRNARRQHVLRRSFSNSSPRASLARTVTRLGRRTCSRIPGC